MKTALSSLFVFTLAGTQFLFGADFVKGDKVELLKDASLYFKDTVFRVGKSGEQFTVLAVQPGTHRVYLSTKDAFGKEIAVSTLDSELLKSKQESTTNPKIQKAKTPYTATNNILDLGKQLGLDLSRPLPDVTGTGKSGGFLGMPWGTPPSIVKFVILARKDSALSNESTPTSLIFTGGRFNDYHAGMYFTFVDAGLASVIIDFSVSGDTNSDAAFFSDLVTSYRNKYGKPEKEIGKKGAVWVFQNAAEKNEAIVLSHSELGISANYSRPDLIKNAEELRKSKLGTKEL